jgi:hypothetical protein
MSIYKIKAVTSKRSFETKYGELMSYKVQITGDDGFEGEAEITQKPATPAPSAGQEIEGTLDKSNPKFPPKLKKAQGGMGGRGGGGKSPKDTESIERQVAYKGAVELAIAFGSNADEGKRLLPEFFEASVALIQGKAKPADPVAAVKEVFPGASEEVKAISRDDLTAAYKGWMNVLLASEKDPDEIAKTFEMKKTALGITDFDSATPEQRKELHDYLTSV